MVRTTLSRLTLGLVAIALVLSSCTSEQTTLHNMVNNSRIDNGLYTLHPHPALADKAQAQAQYMAANNILEHSTNLAAGLPAGWKVVGENVGRGGSVQAIHQAYLNSPGHRANMMDTRYQWIGTGYAVAADGRVYTAIIFAKY